MDKTEPKALKDIFDKPRFEHIASNVSAVWAPFDAERFLALGLCDHAQLSLLQRLRRISQCLRETLPADFPDALSILLQLATRMEVGFASLFLPDFVGQYGIRHFELSIQALKTFTKLGSSEFAVREFLRADLDRTIRVMLDWSRDEDEHVRRLASEGSRPRLPWSFRLQAIIDNPDLTLPILVNLSQDPSLYVRKSVANHLNDVSKDHPQWLLAVLASWPQNHPHSMWIRKRALRTLVKAGHLGALTQVGASGDVAITVEHFVVNPSRLILGDSLTVSAELLSRSGEPQRLVVDYRIHYVKKSGGTSAKVFKMKEQTLSPGARAVFKRRQPIRDFTTRTHYCGEHVVELLVNGKCLAQSSFVLAR